MFSDLGSTGVFVVDILRWVTICWLVVSIGWLVQIAVITRTLSTAFLCSGLSLALFVNLSSQYGRLGNNYVSHQLPIVFIELTMITLGMFFYVKDHEDINFIPPFYFFLRYRAQKKKDNNVEGQG